MAYSPAALAGAGCVVRMGMMVEDVRVVRNRDLEPTWTVRRATEPGFMRSLITWVGGPAGHINTNPAEAVTSDRCAIGLMRMPVGNRQAGVHIHSVTEIYVVLKGEVESYDGVGTRHRAGPLDCLYIPAGVPHGVRTVGDADVELVWLHDAVEREGVSQYLEGDGPFPCEREVTLVPFRDLEPDWSLPRAKEVGYLRWMASWVGGPAGHVNHSPGLAALNPDLEVSLSVTAPGNKFLPYRHSEPETLLVLRGRGITRLEGGNAELGPLDAIHCPGGTTRALRNAGDDPLYVMHVSAPARATGSVTYDDA